jgi:hypothetical protein
VKAYTNVERVRQKRQIGTRFSLAGMGVMAVAFVLVLARPELTGWAWLALLVGIVVSSVGTYHINRWMRPPLPEPLLEQAFKRLDARYVLLNHYKPVPHVLLTPKGLVPIKVKRYEGPIRYDRKSGQWRGRFSIRRFYGHGLTAEGVGNPVEEVQQQEKEVRDWLQAELPDLAAEVPIEGIAFFVSPKTEIDAPGAPVPIAQQASLRKVAQGVLAYEKPLAKETYTRLREALLAGVREDDS